MSVWKPSSAYSHEACTARHIPASCKMPGGRKSWRKSPEAWCKNAIGFITHRSLLRGTLQPIAWTIAVSCMKQRL
ncbi:MAG: hypothetical protein LUI85_17455 [Bacteroides sp.]|nr:hypothetical protein [Bacteroides sp.]